MRLFVLLILLAVTTQGFSQSVTLLTSGKKTSLRGLSVVDESCVWVSGSGGTVGLSLDSGNTWKWMKVPGFDSTEFRDIEAFDGATAIIMGIDSPGVILRTVDAGKSWETVFKRTTKGIFFDAMEFWNEQSGILLGDPIDGRFFIARTFDGGRNWSSIPEFGRPIADSGEACFASSGTNIRHISKSEAVFVSGGRSSNLLIRQKKIKLPLLQGLESTGANSIAVKDKKTMMIVGGDFTKRDSVTGNCVFTDDGGETWKVPQTPPRGYRSCVEFLGGSKWITCGLNGVDYSTDNGVTFQGISKDGYHVCRQAKKGKAVFFAGGNGRIGRLNIP